MFDVEWSEFVVPAVFRHFSAPGDWSGGNVSLANLLPVGLGASAPTWLIVQVIWREPQVIFRESHLLTTFYGGKAGIEG